jgi:transketolase N-terminal domain/subunit
LGLGKLIAFYDDNGISIDGEVEGWFTDDTPKRFEAYNWQVIRNVDGHDPEEIKTAIDTARKSEQADADLLQDHHRLRLAEQARQGRLPRRPTGRRRKSP